MGLDAYWQTPKGKKPPVFNPALSLRNCWVMEDGDYTFGDYAWLLFELSGIPQHTPEISAYSVKSIADAFNSTTRREFNKSKNMMVSAQEWNDLKRMFKAYAKIGASYRVSW